MSLAALLSAPDLPDDDSDEDADFAPGEAGDSEDDGGGDGDDDFAPGGQDDGQDEDGSKTDVGDEGEEDGEESQAALGSDEILDSDERAARPSAEPPLTASNAAGRDVLLPAHFWAEYQRPGLAGWQARIVSKQRKGRLYHVRLPLERTTCRFRLETLKKCKMLS